MMRRIRLAICTVLAWLYERINPPPLPADLATELDDLAALRTASAISNHDALRGIWQASEALATDRSLPENERTAWARQAQADKRAYLQSIGQGS